MYLIILLILIIAILVFGAWRTDKKMRDGKITESHQK